MTKSNTNGILKRRVKQIILLYEKNIQNYNENISFHISKQYYYSIDSCLQNSTANNIDFNWNSIILLGFNL